MYFDTEELKEKKSQLKKANLIVEGYNAAK